MTSPFVGNLQINLNKKKGIKMHTSATDTVSGTSGRKFHVKEKANGSKISRIMVHSQEFQIFLR